MDLVKKETTDNRVNLEDIPGLEHLYMYTVCFEYQVILLQFSAGILLAKEAVDRIQSVLNFAVSIDADVEIFKRLCDLSMSMKSPSAVVFVTVRVALNVVLKKDLEFNLVDFSNWSGLRRSFS
ncbi:hypothetical protein HDU97_010321 [Phlyctochytrium planicorne]|nr:hypothetical protein HDU97_010321 [Phlyctochytrium planicorne]